jgi:hypothetical protein
LNLKTIQQVKQIFGEPNVSEKIEFFNPAMDILFIFEGPLKGFDTYSPILKMEWHYKKEKLTRLIFFVKRNCEWISLCNLLHDEDFSIQIDNWH